MTYTYISFTIRGAKFINRIDNPPYDDPIYNTWSKYSLLGLNCSSVPRRGIRFVMESIRAMLRKERGWKNSLFSPIRNHPPGTVMREFVSGSMSGKLLGRVMPLAGTWARSRNNGNRLNKYLPFPSSTLFQVDYYLLFPAEKSR